jgi:PAS domain S-box-containing protein
LAFIPLCDAGRLLGKFVVYFDRPHPFGDDELHLAENIASHIAHAIQRRRDEAALRESLAIVQIVNEGTPTLLYAKDRDGRMRMANPATLRTLGVTAAQALGRTAVEYWTDKEAAARVMANDRELMERGVAITFEEKIMLPDGPHVFLSTKTPQRDTTGAVIGLVGASIDITDRKRAEERQKLLIRELNHRVKNTLATVQSIAAQTLRGTEGDREARRAFEARLLALSNAHNVLTRESWDGAGIDEIVETALAPHRAADDGRFTVEGPAFRLAPKAALALAMALHELATNAAKYGALSARAGRVRVAWTCGEAGAEARFRLCWRESDGPPVAPPPRKGFGSRLIERGLSLELGGRATIEFQPAGLIYTIDAPLANLAWSAADAPG